MTGQCPDGGIGRRTCFRCKRREAWGFESLSGHHLFFRGHSRRTAKATKPNKIATLAFATVRQRSGLLGKFLGIFWVFGGSQNPLWVRTALLQRRSQKWL